MDVPTTPIPQSTAELSTQIASFTGSALWVTIYKKTSNHQVVTYEDVVEEAICHGFIDTQTRTIDTDRYAILLRRRRPGSSWTAANLEIASKMTSAGRMAQAGAAVLPQR
jgi:hypothetical protein